LTAVLVLLVFPTSADDVGITSARLVELADGGYALEADVAPRMVAALREPVVPERFTLAERPIYRRVGVVLVVRYEFGGSDQALEAGDMLLLPWARSAVLLTARWSDGTVRRGMFPRSAAGIKVPIEALKPVERSAPAISRSHLASEIERGVPMLLRLLVVLGLVVAARGRRSLTLVLVFIGGHAMSMVALDLGVPTVPNALAGAGLALGSALVARSALRDDGASLWPLVLALGLIDGLGIADRLLRSGLGPDETVPALFGAALAADAALIVVTAGLAGAMALIRRPMLLRAAATGVGCIGVAATIAMMVSGLRIAHSGAIDPADRMAAARFELRSGVSAAGASGSGRAAAAPRRLDDPAMIFLTVEPNEVRVEVLLGLSDFLEPLRIEGGPGSVVPVEVQPTIEERAKRMVAQTIGVVIDGREAVPILERTDFVTVAATGVTTRREPEPEPLATSVLGVTLAYGVEGPPSEISLGWQVFPNETTTVPAVWTDPTGSEKLILNREQPVLEWTNDLSSYEVPPVQAVVVDPPRWPLLSVLTIGIAAVVWFGPLKMRRWRQAAWVPLVLAIMFYPFVRTAAALPGLGGWAPAKAEAASIVDDLLTNIYRAFDLRDEEVIYDRLEVSVAGDKLAEIYLENRRALELENRGGARARVDEVEVLEVQSVRRAGEGGFRVEAVWTVSGSVNHFGHVHYRQNRYVAALHIRADSGVWKISEVEILDERRVL
jgi:hypothetical protein